jgi:hypothetical protein
VAFLTLSEAVKVVAERSGGDGVSALVAAAAGGKIRALSRQKEFVTDGQMFEYPGVRGVPAAWWAQIDDPRTREQLGYSIYLRAEIDSLLWQQVLGFHPGTKIPAKQRLVTCHDIHFAEDDVDKLWPAGSSFGLNPILRREQTPPVEGGDLLERVRRFVAAFQKDNDGRPPNQNETYHEFSHENQAAVRAAHNEATGNRGRGRPPKIVKNKSSENRQK